jgi:hypothetical protein
MNSGRVKRGRALSADAEATRSCPSHNYSFFRNSISESVAR